MTTSPPSLTPQTLAKLHGLQLRARHIVEGYVAGLHRSPWHGFSIEFAEHREYVAGDDLRHVDWKLFGRTDKFYLKQYEDETNLLCYLALDVSESMSYRGPNSSLSKFEYAQCLAAAIGRLVLDRRDAVGLSLFDDRLRKHLRPSSSPAQWDPLLTVLDSQPEHKKTNAGPVFHELAERFTKHGVVIILSDFFDDVRSLVAGLKHFTYRRHDVAVLHVLDPAELDFPFSGGMEFVGLEELPNVQADPQALRTAYLAEFEAYQTAFRSACRELGAEYRLVRTDQPLDSLLLAWLSERAARVRA